MIVGIHAVKCFNSGKRVATGLDMEIQTQLGMDVMETITVNKLQLFVKEIKIALLLSIVLMEMKTALLVFLAMAVKLV